MRKKHEIEHERDRRDLWIAVAAATAGDQGCHNTRTVSVFADSALEAFDDKFHASNLKENKQFYTIGE